MNEPTRKTTVTLEDLLRIKRAEQPPAEFWQEFERGMRLKQLAAIVEPRPWWAPFIRVGAKVSRYQLPVGAAAILAITFVTLREYRSVELAPAYEPVSSLAINSHVVAMPVNSDRAAVIPVSVAVAPAVPAVDSSLAAMDAMESEVPANVAKPEATTRVGTVSHVAPVNSELTPSARYMAENLAAAQAVDPELDQVLGRSIRSIENRPTRVEPLVQVSVPGQSRRSRLLAGNAWLASANSGDSALRTDDQSTRRLTERRLSEDAVSRIDVDGSRFTVKF